MKSGDVICIGGAVRHYLDDGKSWVEYLIDKSAVVVAFVLGVKPREEPFDEDHWLAVMNSHGFIRTDQLTDEEWQTVKKRIEAKIADAEKKITEKNGEQQ